jgi:hypothetical protein
MFLPAVISIGCLVTGIFSTVFSLFQAISQGVEKLWFSG